jgi:hypothetical protein
MFRDRIEVGKCIYAHQGAFVHLEEEPKTTETASGEFVINSLGPVLFIQVHQNQSKAIRRVCAYLTNSPYL